MKSMTGFGRGVADTEGLAVEVEIQGVNRKNLEVSVSLPRDWNSLEKTVTDRLRQELARGKIGVHIQYKRTEDTNAVQWDAEAVQASLKALKELAEANNVFFEPNAELLLKIASQTQGSTLPESETIEPVVKAALEDALKGFVQMRGVEGEALKGDLTNRITTLDTALKAIQELTPERSIRYRDQLLERLKQAQIEIDLEDERLLKELSLYADRVDISEEVTRLESHFTQFRTELNKTVSIGRKLDFLCQELNREINTIGSKANDVRITQQVVEMKNELERIREQVQNVE